MKVILENIAQIEKNEIVLDGITVIAGENSTGKSTIGKAIYSVYASLYQNDQKIDSYIYKSIRDALAHYVRYSGLLDLNRFNDFSHNVIEQSKEQEIDIRLVENMLKNEPGFLFKDVQQIEICAKEICSILALSRNDIRESIVQDYLNNEFDEQIVHVNKNNGMILFDIQGKKVIVNINENNQVSLESEIDITSDVIYLDSPLALDRQSGIIDLNNIHHRSQIRYKFNNKSETLNPVTETLLNKKLEDLNVFWNRTVSGSLIAGDKEAAVRMQGLQEPINLTNLATGMKTFLILKTILENGYIKDKGVIILDEPEIHLHPEWQMYLAEMIVLLQKEFSLTILINTHSPYFLNAIEVFSAKYSIANLCKYYLAKKEDTFSKIVDVTRNTDLIYETLAKPFNELEKIMYNLEKDNE